MEYTKYELAALGANLERIAAIAIVAVETGEMVVLGDRQLPATDVLRLVEDGRNSYLEFLLNSIGED